MRIRKLKNILSGYSFEFYLTGRKLKVLYFLGIILLLSGCSVSNYFKMRETDRAFNAVFEKGEKAKFERYRIKGNRIRYCIKGSDTLPAVLFIHGAPASISFWKPFFRDSNLLSMAQVIAADRPGYGYSGFGKLYLSYYTQAALLAPLIKKYGQYRKLILVGSSYGGPLCALLAAQFPQYVSGILLVSSSIAPGEEATWQIARIINSPIGEFFPRVLQVATAEKIHHKNMLKEIEKEWSKVVCPVIMLHGSEDELIFPANANFVYNEFKQARKKITILGGLKHNIVVTKPEYIVQCIKELLDDGYMAHR